jgi:hypothetical protein
MRIAIVTPCYSGLVNLHFALSLITTIKGLKRADCQFFSNIGSSILHMARNQLVAQAMASGAEKIVMIDDDVSWTQNGFERLVMAPERIVAGVYQKKPGHPSAKPEMALSATADGLVPNMHGLCEVDGAATGFLRVDREVFEAMKPHCQKIHDDNMSKAECDELFEYFAFDKMIKDGKTYVHGEDFRFCHKARDAGFRTYIDPNIKLGHHLGGMKFDASLNTIDLL